MLHREGDAVERAEVDGGVPLHGDEARLRAFLRGPPAPEHDAQFTFAISLILVPLIIMQLGPVLAVIALLWRALVPGGMMVEARPQSIAVTWCGGVGAQQIVVSIP